MEWFDGVGLIGLIGLIGLGLLNETFLNYLAQVKKETLRLLFQFKQLQLKGACKLRLPACIYKN